jgi:cysteine desulfurase
MSKKMVYLDHSATTPLNPEVLQAMLPYFNVHFGNASSIYSIARQSKKAIEEAREQVAVAIGCEPKEVYFTSSGTEADNWALKGVMEARSSKGKHLITTTIEHPAVLDTCKFLETQGYEVTYLKVDPDGLISMQELEDAIRSDTVLISIMMANNEIGTVQPVEEIGLLAKSKDVLFHTDAVQAVGSLPIDVKSMNLDLMTLSGHKFYGPKGVGVLYVKKGVKLAKFLHGGHQERGKRGSTENVAGIVGLGKAIELATAKREENHNKLVALREKLFLQVMDQIPYVKLNGHRTRRLPGNLNFSFEFIEGESLLLMLDMKGICASSGSACTSGSLDPSHVLLGIGLPHEIAHGSLRISLGIDNTEEDIAYFMEVLPQIVQRLREMSPLYEKVQRRNE